MFMRSNKRFFLHINLILILEKKRARYHAYRQSSWKSNLNVTGINDIKIEKIYKDKKRPRGRVREKIWHVRKRG
jgi:hypothetical protein